MSDSVTRVVAIEDETLQRESQERLVGDGFTVIAAYASVEEFLEASPDAELVLLDLWIRPQTGPTLPLRGLPAVKAITHRGYRVLIYTSDSRRLVLARLLHAGAHGVVLKSEPKEALLEAIAKVSAGEVVLTTELTGLAEYYQSQGLLPRLTKRQTEVLRWRARGLSVDAITKRLHIARSTVEKATTETNAEFRRFLLEAGDSEFEGDGSPSPAVLAKMMGVGPGDLLDPDATRWLSDET
jgi:DNA-binding NarL/FixJ family response regulator